MNTTFKIAVYGAILSTLNAIWQFLSYRRDRANIKVVITSELSGPPIFVRVFNSGRRIVILERYIIKLVKSTKIKFAPEVELSEGKAYSFSVTEAPLIKYNITYRDLSIGIIDATGKCYWSDNLLMRSVKLRRCKHKIAKVKD